MSETPQTEQPKPAVVSAPTLENLTEVVATLARDHTQDEIFISEHLLKDKPVREVQLFAIKKATAQTVAALEDGQLLVFCVLNPGILNEPITDQNDILEVGKDLDAGKLTAMELIGHAVNRAVLKATIEQHLPPENVECTGDIGPSIDEIDGDDE